LLLHKIYLVQIKKAGRGLEINKIDALDERGGEEIDEGDREALPA
jgi:hypothetical protein